MYRAVAAPIPAHGNRDRKAAQLAERHHGVLDFAELRACGIDDATRGRRLRAGRLFLAQPGVCSFAPPGALSVAGRMRAVTRSLGDGAAISHRTAACLHGFWRGKPPHDLDVSTPRNFRPRAGANVRRSAGLTRDQIVRLDDVDVTSTERTLIDLGDVLTAWQVANALHEAFFRLSPSREVIDDLVAGPGPRHRAAVLRHALRLLDEGSRGTKSFLEDAWIEKLVRSGVVETWVNRHVPVADGALEADTYWPSLRLNIEIDGSGHGRVHTAAEDAARDARFAAVGIEVIRLGPREVHHPDPALLARLPRRRGRR